MKVNGSAWVSSEDSDEYWAEGVKCIVEVETTDADEVRVGILLVGEDTETAGVYLSRSSASDLAKFLAAAAVDEVRISA